MHSVHKMIDRVDNEFSKTVFLFELPLAYSDHAVVI